VGKVLVIGERTLPFADIQGITLSDETLL